MGGEFDALTISTENRRNRLSRRNTRRQGLHILKNITSQWNSQMASTFFFLFLFFVPLVQATSLLLFPRIGINWDNWEADIQLATWVSGHFPCGHGHCDVWTFYPTMTVVQGNWREVGEEQPPTSCPLIWCAICPSTLNHIIFLSFLFGLC